MKNVLRILICFLLCSTVLGYTLDAQVLTNGAANNVYLDPVGKNLVIGDVDAGFAKLKVSGTNQIDFAINAISGIVDFTLQENGKSKAQVRYSLNQGLEFMVDANNTGGFAIGADYVGLRFDGNTQYAGFGMGAALMPATRLHVKDSLEIQRIESSTSVGYLSFFDDTGAIGYAGMKHATSSMDFGTATGNVSGDVHLVTAGDPKLTVDGATGKVGIGTDDPDSRLHVYNGAGSGGSTSSLVDVLIEDNRAYLELSGTQFSGLTFNDGGQSIRAGMFFNHTTNNIMFRTGSTDNRMVINETGKIGMGTTSPTTKLDVDGKIRMRPGAVDGYIPVSDADGGMTWANITTVETPDVWDTNGTHVWRATGKVGIGTSAPSSPLHIKTTAGSGGGIRLQSESTSEDWYMHMANDDHFTLRNDASDLLILTKNDGRLGLSEGNPEAQLDIKADTTGIKVTTTHTGNNDYIGLESRFVTSAGYGYGAYLTGGYKGLYALASGAAFSGTATGVQASSEGTAGTRRGVYGYADNPGGTYAYGVRGNATNATNNYGIYGAGSGGATNYAGYFNGNVHVVGIFTNPSDAKLKKNVKNYENALEIIGQLETKSYEYRTDKYSQMYLDSRPQVGFIAQEVEKVLPNLVSEQHLPETTEEGENGREVVIAPAIDYKAINYVGLIPVLTQGIKELSAEVEAKDTQIEELNARVENLEAQVSQVKNLDQVLAQLDALDGKLKNMEAMEIRINELEKDLQSCCLSSDAKTGSNDPIFIELEGKDQPALEQNAPNPFNVETTIKYYVPSSAIKANVTITDMKGSVLKSVVLEGSGFGLLNIRAGELSPGTYSYTLFVDGMKIETKQMVLIK